MSVFTSKITERIEIPHDPGQFVTFRKLAPKHLEAARDAAKAGAFEDAKRQMEVSRMLGDELIKSIMAARESGEVERATANDPLLMYDQTRLCVSGIKAWTYDGVKVEPATIEDLDERTQEFIARAILKLSKPELFQTEDESEAARKNA